MVNTALNAQRKKLYLYPMVDVQDLDLPEEEVSISGIHFTQLIEMIQGLPRGCQIVFNLFAMKATAIKRLLSSWGSPKEHRNPRFARAKSLLQQRLSKESAYYERYGEAKNLRIRSRRRFRGLKRNRPKTYGQTSGSISRRKKAVE